SRARSLAGVRTKESSCDGIFFVSGGWTNTLPGTGSTAGGRAAADWCETKKKMGRSRPRRDAWLQFFPDIIPRESSGVRADAQTARAVKRLIETEAPRIMIYNGGASYGGSPSCACGACVWRSSLSGV